MPEIDFLANLDCANPSICKSLAVAALFVAAWLADVLVRRLGLAVIRKAAAKTKGKFDDALIERKVVDRLAHVVPVAVIYLGIDTFGIQSGVVEFLRRLAAASLVFIFVRAFSALLDAVNDVYVAVPEAKQRPIKGYLQVISLVAYALGGVLVLAVLLGKSPLAFLGGIGAMSAVLLLVFKDTLLSLVASVQLTSNDMIRIGDWIEAPEHGADGDVEDIALHTVKVRNWDKTRTTIPTYALISKGFKNWRGMGEAGGRRIRRALNIDASTIRHLQPEEAARFSRYELLRPYMAQKTQELESYNAAHPRTDDSIGEQRRLTNIGTLRAYVRAYLEFRADIRKDMTLLVRQLEPTPSGVPLDIYCFTATTEWAAYESIQADIFDHLLAILPEFGLRVFQNPTGADFRHAWENAAS